MSKLALPVGPGDHLRGDPNAPVTLVEYGDYECPHCGQAHRVVPQALQRVGDRVRFVYRHFPLAEIHPRALEAAEAAEAAAAQGQFWPMHDAIFENQVALAREDLVGYAAALGLDAVRVTDELERHTHLARVKRDFASGVRSGVNGTPTFFVEGVRLDLPWDVDTLTAVLEAAIEAKGSPARPARRAG